MVENISNIGVNPESPERRAFSSRIASVAIMGGIASVSSGGTAQATTGSSNIHRFEQTVPFPVNAYIVEGAEGIVVIDSTLTNTASRALKERIDSFDKPLKGLLLTHPHPDHYAGIHNVMGEVDAPVLAVEGVNRVVRRDDATKNDVIGPMFSDEWPSTRRFPTEIVKEGEKINLGPGLQFNVMDIGPAESFHDSVFLLDTDRPTAFAGDIVYSMMHAYMADNQNPEWQAAMDRLGSELREDTVMYVGHGQPVTPALLKWQSNYLSNFEMALRQADWRDKPSAIEAVSNQMKDFLPNDDLLFLMQLSIETNAQRLGLLG